MSGTGKKEHQKMLIQSFAFHAKDSKTQSDSSDWEVHSLLVAGTWP